MKTKEEILKLIRKADAGDAESQNELAVAYYDGNGIDKNVVLAMSWYEVSASNGNEYALANLADRYRRGSDGYPKDLTKAFELYKKSAEQCCMYSIESLGVFFDLGYGTPCDYKKAVKCYKKAALAGMSAAQNNLGNKFELGKGVVKNYIKAYKWYQMSAMQDDIYAQCNLGRLYENGQGVYKNLKLAIYWYRKSAAKGHARAQKCINSLLEKYDENIDRYFFILPEFISNPFRVLGVFSNASAREITANKSKIMAFDKIKRLVKFPLDSIIMHLYKPKFSFEVPLFDDFEYTSDNAMSLNELYVKIQKTSRDIKDIRNAFDVDENLSEEQQDEMDDKLIKLQEEQQKLYQVYEHKVKELYSIIRNEDTINQALAKISQPIDKIKYALFWFINVTSLDQTAIENLINGNVERACELWDVDEDEETFSSLINCALTFLVLEDEYNFVRCMTTMIHNDSHRKDFVYTVCSETFTISEEDLSHIFIDVLLERLPNINWVYVFNKSGVSVDDNHYLDFCIAKKSINKLTKKIENIGVKKGSEQYNDALSLMELSAEELTIISNLLGRNNLQYQTIADRVARKIISIARNYYRECCATIYLTTKHCVELNEYAYEIAENKILKSELNDSLKQIREKLSKLPSERSFTLINNIIDIIKKESVDNNVLNNFTFENPITRAQRLLKRCLPHLIELKEILGHDNESYIKISTSVADKCIEMVISKINKEINKASSPNFRMSPAGLIGGKYWELHDALKQGYLVFTDVMLLNVDKDFRQKRFWPNHEKIIDLIIKFDYDFLLSVKPTISLLTETECFKACKTPCDFKNYTKKYPKGKYLVEANKQIDLLTPQEEFFWHRCKQNELYFEYLEMYKNGIHMVEAKKEYDKQLRIEDDNYWLICSKRKIYSAYSKKYKEGKNIKEAQKYLKEEKSNGHLFAIIFTLLSAITSVLCIIYFVN